MAISNLVSLDSLQAKNAATSRLAPKNGLMALPGINTASGAFPSSKLTITPQSNVTSLGGLQQPVNRLAAAPQQQQAVPVAPQQAAPQPLASQQMQYPAYDGKTGLLTDYGRSQGLPEVNAPKQQPKGATAAPTQPQFSANGLFPNVVTSLANRSLQPSPAVTQGMSAYQKAVEAQNKLKSNIASQYGRMESDPIPLEFQQGREQAMARQYASQLAAGEQSVTQQQAAVGFGLQQQGLEQQALQQAAAFAQPQMAEYGKTTFDPITGMYSAGGGGDFGASMDTYAQAMANNSINPSQIPSGISNNPVLFAQLMQKAQQLNPAFNPTEWQANVTAQSTALQQNVSTGLTMQRSATAANQALDTLLGSYSSLGANAKGSFFGLTPNIPIVSQIAQQLSMSTGVGREAVSAFQGALKEARAQINTVLAPLIGVDSANATSNSLLPDNMTPAEIPQKVAAAKEYIRQRVEAFTKTGGVPQYGQGSTGYTGNGGGSITWDSLGD